LQTLYAVYEALALCLVVNWANPDVSKTRASVPSAVLTLIGYLAIPVLSYAEHVKSVRPSSILSGYLFVSLLCDVARARTLWLRDNDKIASDFTAAVALKFGLLLLESIEKRRILLPNFRHYPLEATSGIINRAFFCWLNPLFARGFSKILSYKDLSGLDKHLKSDHLDYLLNSAWLKGWTTGASRGTLLLTKLCSDHKESACPILDYTAYIKMAFALCRCTPTCSDIFQLLPAVSASQGN
jgi:hypothetical protein